ncbi:MAG: DUF1631 family protein [Marinobacter sp.]|uniref:DUF1631 family protein n=1 Tax=Marinobacter sp. TaxID=50741 RepID=UPI00299EEA51|nr:DUF1631 family protein [Marinobacter sp.]MDX1633114.1 DUF1631 family protein [Marinobacter sp.]
MASPSPSQNLKRFATDEPVSGVSPQIAEIIQGLRVPDLPYPIGKVETAEVPDWRPLLEACWNEQRDEPVTHLLRSVSLTWTVSQVNAAYLADRIMDVFLRTSGLHPVLVQRVARLRFLLAWRMAASGSESFEDSIRAWLDSLGDWRGWSDSGGRSARALLDQLDTMGRAVSESFAGNSLEPFERFAADWHREAEQRRQRSDKLHQRLLETERGAARQRKAEHTARALVGRALKGRQLPEAILIFILDTWMPLLRQAAWNSGTDSDDWRHAGKLLEWLVWVGDPALSDRDRDRLYHVGEQLGDKLNDVWTRIHQKPLPESALDSVTAELMARLRGEAPSLVAAISPSRPFSYDSQWLGQPEVDSDRLAGLTGHWFVEGEGAGEQRRFFLGLLAETGEVLWTNGFGVKLAVTPWSDLTAGLDSGAYRRLPELNSFGGVLGETVSALSRVLTSQRQQREKAAAVARARAEELRRAKEQAELQRQQEEAVRKAEQARQQAEAEARRQQDEADAQRRLEAARRAEAEALVNAIKLGGWIVREDVTDSTSDVRAAQRLKLAVRLNATRKLVFVDRLGLNRVEFQVSELVDRVLAGEIRVLNQSAEFDDTLTRVVGRLRVGKNQ